jgi:hypothetical protein
MFLKKSLSVAFMVFACANSNINATELNANQVDKMKGSPLPYTVMVDDLKNNAKKDGMLEIRNGGYGSDMTGHPANKNQFYALTDRGPNTTYKKAILAKKKYFLLPITPHALVHSK